MSNVTVRCGCGRQMTEVGDAPRGTFRCGCGAKVQVVASDRATCTALSERDDRCAFPPVRASADYGLSLCRDHLQTYLDALAMLREVGGSDGHWRPPLSPAEWLEQTDQLRMEAWNPDIEERKRRLERYEAQAVVYYVRIRDTIKIGTTVNMRSRMPQLMIDELLATEPGGEELEDMRHKQFAGLRIRGERFRPEPELMSHIAMIREHFGEPVITGTLYENGQAVRSRLGDLRRPRG